MTRAHSGHSSGPSTNICPHFDGPVAPLKRDFARATKRRRDGRELPTKELAFKHLCFNFKYLSFVYNYIRIDLKSDVSCLHGLNQFRFRCKN